MDDEKKLRDMQAIPLDELIRRQAEGLRNMTDEERAKLQAALGYPEQNSEEAKEWNRQGNQPGADRSLENGPSETA